MRTNKRLLIAAAVVAYAGTANAGLITSLPGGTPVTMPTLNAFGPGPQTFDSGEITWSSQFTNSVFGWTEYYGFVNNGSWSGALGPMAGLNCSTGDGSCPSANTMTFAFAAPVSAVGGLINYATPAYGTASIAVYDTSNTLIESDVITCSTSGNDQGCFFGFQESTADIGYFTLTDAYIGITDMAISSATSVPEPATLSLIGLGVAGIGLVRRKRQR